MPQSPRETLSPRETRSPSIVPENPMGSSEMSIMKSRVCEKLLLAKDVAPVLHIKAVWQRKDASTSAKRTSHGKIRREGKEMWAVWEDDPTREYPFPPNDLNYFRIDQEEADPQSSNNLPETQPLDGGRPLPPNLQSFASMNSLKLDPYEPITWPAWIDARNDEGFRIRDLIRELKEAPEYGLRLNQFFQDRSFQKQQERNFDNLLGKWIMLARDTPGWSEGPFLELGKAIVQSLRDSYWRACKVDVEAVHQKLDKEDRSHDKFYQHVSDQLSDREKYRARYSGSNYVNRSYRSFGQPRQMYPSYASSNVGRPVCYICRSPDHFLKDCPYKRSSPPDFRQRAAGSAHSAKTL